MKPRNELDIPFEMNVTVHHARFGNNLEVLIYGIAEGILEPNYGADADGNRGIDAFFVKKIKIESSIILNADDKDFSFIWLDHEIINKQEVYEWIESYIIDSAEEYQ